VDSVMSIIRKLRTASVKITLPNIK
jgi:hypothetical protein